VVVVDAGVCCYLLADTWIVYFLLLDLPLLFSTAAIKLHLKEQLRGLSAYMDSMLMKMKTSEDEIVRRR
jgi:hypothetical protein